MFDKMLGVSPTQKGLAQDSKAVDKETLQPDFKKDFERQLQKKLDEKVKASTREEPQRPKSQSAKKNEDELRAERNVKKPSGGTKKKMVESEDEKIVSNVMASIESEIETPNPDKDLAQIEVDGTIEAKIESAPNTFEKTFARAGQAASESESGEQNTVSAQPSLTSAIQTYTEAKDQDGLGQALIKAQGLPQGQAIGLTPDQVAALKEEMSETSTSEVSTESILAALQSKAGEVNTQTGLSADQAALSGVNDLSSRAQVLTEAQELTNSGSTPMEKSQPSSEGKLQFGVGREQDSQVQTNSQIVTPEMAQALDANAAEAEDVSANRDLLKAIEQRTSLLNGLQSEKVSQLTEMTQLDPEAQLQMEVTQAQAGAVEGLQTQAPAKKLSFEEELGRDVGFESDMKQHLAALGLSEKMKESAVDKKSSSDTVNAFEQKVLAQLQQEGSYLAKQTSAANQENSGFSQNESSDTMKDSSAELKSDRDQSDMPLHAGASHTDFKAHLSSPIEKAGSLSPMAKLMENKDENVQEIMKQSHFLAVKGGGEMNVKMSPDGMGEIQLKVLMQDGKINIEMQTHDKNVKKLIEESLSELKSGLAAQQLNVDHVKISTVNATNTENSAQFQSNLSHGQGGDTSQQKDFWKSFQENLGHQSRNRSAYGDSGSVRSRAQSDVNSSQAAKTAAIRSYGRTGSTLNRVA